MGKIKLTTEIIKERAILVHGEKYDYTKLKYINSDTKICILCKEHGEFWQSTYHHLNGQGCPKCRYIMSGLKNTRTLDDFIKLANMKHNNFYDYTQSIYTNDKTKLDIICPEHGLFKMTPNNHLGGQKCPTCGRIKTINSHKLNNRIFMKKGKLKHNNKYNYSKVNYINSITKVIIKCPKHGEFSQQPNNHLHGQGCPICKHSKLEMMMANLLNDNGIVFEEQKKFSWLGRQSLDFYLPKYNIAIECQGKQHFDIGGWNDVKELSLIKKRDYNKKILCLSHNIKILYYSNLGIKYPYQVFENHEELFTTIKTNVKNQIEWQGK